MLLDPTLLRQTRDHRLALIITILSGMLCAVLIVFQASKLSNIINGVFLSGETLRSQTDQLTLLGIIILLRAFFQYWTESIPARMGIDIKENIRRLIIQKMDRLGPVQVSGEKSGELTTLLTDGVEALDPYFSQYIPQLVLAGLIPLIVVSSIFPRDPVSFAVLLFTAPLLPLFMYLLGSMAEKSTQKQWNSLLRLGSHFYDTIQGLSYLKSINLSRTRGMEIQENNDRYYSLTMNVLKLTFLSAFTLEFIATISTAVIAVEIGLRLLSGQLQFENALFILLLAPEFYLPLRQLGMRFHSGMSGRTASLKIFQFLDRPEQTGLDRDAITPEMEEYPEISIDPIAFFPIVFDHISAKYPGSDEQVITDVSFRIGRNEKVALVGKSGVGKTTISYVLMGLIKPEKGYLAYGNYPPGQISSCTLMKFVSWVPQTPYIFAGSILENICMFATNPNMAKVEQAAKSARMEEFILHWPDRYHHQVGEGGSLISTGQAQRLALARAFYKDTPLLVMDEPTSSVDPETETALMEGISALQQNKTVLTVAHRLSTIKEYDRIMVMDQGKIEEIGNHDDLMSRKGIYFDLVSGAAPR